MFFYSRTLLAEGGYFAFMDTIIKKIIIDAITLSIAFILISVTSILKSNDFI